MKQKILKLMEKAISSAGKWIWIELVNDSIQLEFEDVQIYKPTLEEYSKHSSELAICLTNNTFFTLFYNDINDINFLGTTDDFSYKVSNDGLKFQDLDFFKKINNSYDYRKTLVGELDDAYNIDFLLIISFGNIAIACGANHLNFFNDFESLTDEDIRRLSNQWCIYWLDYWKSKETDNEYEYDPACEIIPLI